MGAVYIYVLGSAKTPLYNFVRVKRLILVSDSGVCMYVTCINVMPFMSFGCPNDLALIQTLLYCIRAVFDF